MGSVASANAANFGAPAGAALPQTFVEIPKTEERAITLAQLKMVWAYIEEHAGEWTDTFEGSPTYQQPLHTLTVNLHHVKDNMIKPFTEEARCSFVERIAQGPQPPQWFVSHWWGEEVCQFLACVEEHARLRHLGTAVAYWICAYANNQWRIEDEIQCNPRETPFFKAMSLSVGTLSIVDSAAVTYTRIWCSFEVSVALTDMGVDYLYDIAATNGDAQVVVLTDGVTPADEEEGRRLRWKHVGGAYGHLLNRQRNFPIKVFELGFRVKLEEGKATEERDRRHILNCLADQELDADPFRSHPRYDNANTWLHWRLGVACLATCFELGLEEQQAMIQKAPEPPNSEYCFKVYKKMRDVFHGTARYKLAQTMAEHCLRLLLTNRDPENPDVEESYYFIATVYQVQGKLDEALQYHTKALDIRTKTLGPEHPAVGASYNNIAVVYHDEGKLDEALEYHTKALDIRTKTLGPKSPYVAVSYNNIANVYQAQGKLDEALEYHTKALGIGKKSLGATA